VNKYSVSAFFPQAPAGHAWQNTETVGSSLPVALAKAMRILMKRDHVKGRRHKEVKVTIQFVGKVNP
jgi:hypothetical protein